MTVRQFEVPFFTGADRLTRDGPPRTADFDFWTLVGRKSTDGSVAIEVPYTLLALMGDGPFKIFLAAAKMRAIITWNDVEDTAPALIQRFYDMLENDLKIITPPWYYNDQRRKLIIVSGMANRGRYEPRVSATQRRMMDGELRRRRRQRRLIDAERRGLLSDLIP